MSILIVGGTKGIGLAIAKAFAPDAGDVFLGYRSDEAAAEHAAQAVKATGGRQAPGVACGEAQESSPAANPEVKA